MAQFLAVANSGRLAVPPHGSNTLVELRILRLRRGASWFRCRRTNAAEAIVLCEMIMLLSFLILRSSIQRMIYGSLTSPPAQSCSRSFEFSNAGRVGVAYLKIDLELFMKAQSARSPIPVADPHRDTLQSQIHRLL